MMLHGLISDLNLTVIHRTDEDKLIWEQENEGGYTVNSCMLAFDSTRFVGTKLYGWL